MMSRMKDCRLDQPREWIGQWWRPDQPAAVAAGVLTYDPVRGITLRLIGAWEYRTKTELALGVVATHDEVERWPVLHGRCGNSELTLVEPWVESSRGPLGGDPEEMTLSAITVLDGCHLESPDSAVFVGAHVSVENLAGWEQRGRAEFSLLHHKRPKGTDEDEGSMRTVTATVGDVEASLHSSSSFRSTSIRRDGRREERWTKASVSFSSDNARSMEEWFSMVSAVSDLVSLSTMSACADLTISLDLPPNPERLREGHPLREFPQHVDVYQKHVVQPNADAKAAIWNDFVLSEADLPWAQLFPAWVEVRKRFSSSRSMILGLRYITSGYLDSRVVTAVGAAEAFHRALDTPPPIPPDEFATLRRQLLEAVPTERKTWLNDRIQWNEPSLKNRLVDLATRPGAFMTRLVPEPDLWAKTAARARNDLAHRGDAGKDYELLHAVVEVTSAVVIMNLLHEIGVPVQRLEAALSEHREFRWAADLARKHFTKSNVVNVTDS